MDVEWTKRAERDLKRLDRQDRPRVADAVRRLAESGHGDVRPLRGRPGMYRLRVGDHRVLFWIHGAPKVLIVDRVLHRREAYR